MNLNINQLDILSKYFADLSKFLVISTVIEFFIPALGKTISITTFFLGLTIAVTFIALSLKLAETS